ncbi:MAG: TlpA disulfide reductase family protein [Pseudoxanthomonas suwonensis]|nr:TlpA disulfide reductase family protein [Pseudoxanthomonas suwonensis]
MQARSAIARGSGRPGRWTLLPVLLLLSGALLASQGGTPPRPGEIPAPALGSAGGTPVNLEAMRGKVVIVTFWATWCGPCMRELPVLANFQRVVGEDALQVVAINFKEDRRTVNDFTRRLRDTGILWVHDTRGTISDDWGITTLPRMFAINAEGEVAFTHNGYSEASLPRITKQVLELLPDEVKSRPSRHAPPDRRR